MEVRLYVWKSDQGVDHISERVRPHLSAMSSRLSGEYGGPMEHLWIELEVSSQDADRRPPWPFRLQKSVSSRMPGDLTAEPACNVGYYSVRPDHFALAQVPLEQSSCYLLRLIYESTALLEGERRLRGFDAASFRGKFRSELQQLGCWG